MKLEFFPFHLDQKKKLLFRGGVRLEVEVRVVELIGFLISVYPETAGRRELIDHLWPNQEISDASLTQLISRARKTLEDDGKQPRFIKTVHGVGVRWLMPPGSVSQSPSLTEKPSKRRSERPFGWISFAVAMVLLALWSAYGEKETNNLPLLADNRPHSVAILPFNNATDDDRNIWVELGLMDMVGQLLDESSGINTIPSSQILAYLDNQSVDSKPKTAEQEQGLFEEICGLFGCDLLLLGEITAESGPLAIRYRLITALGAFPSRQIQGQSILELTDVFANAVIKQVDPAQPWLVDVSHTYSANPQANQAYAIGVQAILDRELEVAKRYLEIALDQQPDFLWAMVRLAEVESRLANTDLATSMVEKLLSLKNLPADIHFQARHVMSNTLYARGKLEESRALTEELYYEAEKDNRPIIVGQEQMNIGTSSQKLGDLELAVSWLRKADQSFSLAGFTPGQAQVAFNLGNVYLDQNKYKDALTQYQLASKVFSRLGNEFHVTFADHQAALASKSLGDLDAARIELLSVVEQYQKLGHIEGRLLVLLDLAHMLQLQGKVEESVISIRSVLAELEELDLPYVRNLAHHHLAFAYVKLHKPDEARKWLLDEGEFETANPSFTLLPAMLAWEEKNPTLALELAHSVRESAGDAWLPSHQAIVDEMSRIQESGAWLELDF